MPFFVWQKKRRAVILSSKKKVVKFKKKTFVPLFVMETGSTVPKMGFSGIVLILGNEQKNGFKGKMHLHKVKYFVGGIFFQ